MPRDGRSVGARSRPRPSAQVQGAGARNNDKPHAKKHEADRPFVERSQQVEAGSGSLRAHGTRPDVDIQLEGCPCRSLAVQPRIPEGNVGRHIERRRQGAVLRDLVSPNGHAFVSVTSQKVSNAPASSAEPRTVNGAPGSR